LLYNFSVFTHQIRGWIMPAIVSGTVLRWKVDNTDTSKPRVVFGKAERISVYAADRSEDSEASAIIAEYILKKKGDAIELLNAARSGLLEVVGIERMSVSVPPVPPNWGVKSEAAEAEDKDEPKPKVKPKVK
jgi:hypothetical protein